MANMIAQEGEYVEAGGADDPDLNQAFWDFAEQIKSEANAGGSIAVFEVPTDVNGTPRPNTKHKPKLFTVPVGSCTLDDICDRVLREFVEPGGKIMIQILARKDGVAGVMLNRLVPLRRGKTETPGASNGTMTGDVAAMLRMMNEQRNQDRAEMRELLATRGAPLVDPMAQALAITQTITGLASGLVNKNAAPAPAESMVASMTAMLGLMKMMKGFIGGDAEPKNESAGILENIRAIAAPLLSARAAEQERALVAEKRMLAHERPPPAPQAPVAKQTTTAAKTPSEESKMKLMAMLKETLPFLVEIAINKSDPADTARMALKEIPEDDHDLSDALYALTQEDDCLKQMAVLEPRVMEHRDWFEKFRVALRDEFDPDRIDAAEAKA